VPEFEKIRLLCYIGSLDAGGAERQVLTILRHLDRTRFEPMLLLARQQGALLGEVPDDVPVDSLDVARTGKLARWQRMRRFAQILHERQIDVVYDRTYLATLDAAGACWLRRTPRLSAAVADPAVQFAMYARFPKWLWRRYSRWAYRTANLVLANSAGLQQQMIDFWQLPREKVVLQPNAFDFERIDRLAAGPDPMPAPRRFRILTVGRIDDDKGHADFLAAMDELVHRRGMTGVLWQIIGTGPCEHVLRSRVQKLRLTENVQFLGVVANPFPLYRGADVFVLPSRTEGLPNVLIESLACGTPVISTDCESGPREILEDGRFGTLVPVRQPAALVEAVNTCRHNLVTERERAALGCTSVRDRFAAVSVVKVLEKCILRVSATGESQGAGRSEKHR
jgi:glycosyltransferase involved in cell wall biosynthesis